VCIKNFVHFLISQSEKSSLLSLIFSLFILSLAAHDFSDWFCDFAQQSFESILLAFVRFAFDVLSVASLNLRRCLSSVVILVDVPLEASAKDFHSRWVVISRAFLCSVKNIVV